MIDLLWPTLQWRVWNTFVSVTILYNNLLIIFVGRYFICSVEKYIQMFCKQIMLIFHYYLSQSHLCFYPFTQQHRWLILDGRIFFFFLSVCHDISRLMLQRWLYLTPFHIHILTGSACLVGNISQSAVSWLWLPVSWRCFPWQRW